MIRKGALSDTDAIDKIARKYKSELAFVRRTLIERAITNKMCHVVELDGAVIGFVLFNTRRDKTTTIYDIAIDPSHTGHGYGRNLLYSVPAPMQLKCKADNQTAIQFYRNAGMTQEDAGKNLVKFTMQRLVIFCAGNNKRHPQIARAAGMAYGSGQYDKPQDYPFMLDVDWKAKAWRDYLGKVYKYRPVMAIVTDYEHPSQRRELYKQIKDLKRAGVLRIVVVPKFKGAIKHIPLFCIIGLSIPTKSEKYAGWLPDWQDMSHITNRRVHLLGGTPSAQSAEVDRVALYGGTVISVDGNGFQKAATRGNIWTHKWQATENFDYYKTLEQSAINVQRYINNPSAWLDYDITINARRYKMRQLKLF